MSSVKVCEVSKDGKGRVKLNSFSMIPLAEATIIEDEIQKVEDVVQAIAQAVDSISSKTKNICLGLSGQNTMTKRMQVPDGSKDEIEDHIIWESEQYIPYGAEETELDFNILGDNEGGAKDSIIAAARTDIVDSYIEVVEEAHLNVKIVDLNVFALSNIFEYLFDDYMDTLVSGCILLDFGAQTVKVVVYKNSAPAFTKEITWGGVYITEEIQRQMGVSYKEAEDLKVNGDSSGNLPEEVLTIIQEQINNQMEELRKVLNFYVLAGSSERVDKCFITGGTSLLPGLQESVTEALSVPVEYLNFSDRVNYGNLNDDQIAYVNSSGAVVLGLALRGII